MTWAQRVGDLATNIALVFINLARIVTFVARAASDKVDGLVTALGERSEEGLRPTDTPKNSWTRFLAAVAWGVAAVALRLISLVTVFARQVSTTVDEFLRGLAEG